MTEQSSPPRTLVLDTSVAVKFYVREGLHEEALAVLAAAESGAIELIAPSTLQPEGTAGRDRPALGLRRGVGQVPAGYNA